MQAGFGEVVVTPPLGTEMAGYFNQRLAEGIRDDLYSRAMVVSEGNTGVALVVTDLIGVPEEDVEAVRRHVEARTGLPGSHILVAATHTHTGPVTHAYVAGVRRDEEYMRTWARMTAGAVELAFRNQAEVTIGAGKGRLPGVAFNRRFRMKNGHVHTNPGIGNPDIVEPAGPADPEVTVVRFDGPDGRPIGILTSFACHPDTLGGNHFSADWIGVAARKLRELLAPAWVERNSSTGGGGHSSRGSLGGIVLNGACGDINHINVNDPGRRRRWPTVTEEIGAGVAAETARIAMGLTTAAANQVGAAFRRIQLRSIPLAELLAQCRRAVADPNVGRMERMRAQVYLDHAEFYKDSPAIMEAEELCLRMGPAVIASCPGELSCELGLAFKQSCPLPFPMIANLSNGYLGYIPATRAYKEGGYESRASRLQPGSGEEIVAAASSLARELVRREDDAALAAG